MFAHLPRPFLVMRTLGSFNHPGPMKRPTAILLRMTALKASVGTIRRPATRPRWPPGSGHSSRNPRSLMIRPDTRVGKGAHFAPCPRGWHADSASWARGALSSGRPKAGPVGFARPTSCRPKVSNIYRSGSCAELVHDRFEEVCNFSGSCVGFFAGRPRMLRGKHGDAAYEVAAVESATGSTIIARCA
jgi:hypothetical protein